MTYTLLEAKVFFFSVPTAFHAYFFPRCLERVQFKECKSLISNLYLEIFISQNLYPKIADECIRIRARAAPYVPFRFHRSWPQDDLGAVERTRTVASGEAAGNDSSKRSRYLPRINLAKRRKASKGKCRREGERQSILEYR